MQGAINPLSLAPKLYLSSLLGLSGFADGASVTSWPDQSASGFNAAAADTTFPVMRRTGFRVSANGSPTVSFDGLTQGIGDAGDLTTNIPYTNGLTVIAYGRMYGSVSGPSFCSVVWQPGTSVPQVETTTSAPCDFSPGWHDSAGDHCAGRDNIFNLPGASPPNSIYGLWSWQFTPAASPMGCVYTPNEQPRFCATGNYSFGWQASGIWNYTVGANPVGNCPTKMDLAALVVYDKQIGAGQVNRIGAFFRSLFG